MKGRSIAGVLVIGLAFGCVAESAEAPAGNANGVDAFNLYYGFYRPRQAAELTSPAAPLGPPPAFYFGSSRRLPPELLLRGVLSSALSEKAAKPDPSRARAQTRTQRLTDAPDTYHLTTSAPYRTTSDPGASHRFQNLHGYFPSAVDR